MKELKITLIVIFIAIFLGILATYNYLLRNGYIYLAEQFEVYTLDQLWRVVYPTWNDKLQLFSIADFTKLYYYALLIFFGKLFSSYKLTQWLAIVLPIVVSYLSSYLMLFEFLKRTYPEEFNKQRAFSVRLLAILTGSFIYTINPLITTHPRNVFFRIDYALMPLILYLILKIISTTKRSKNKLVKYAFFLAFTLSLAYGWRMLFITGLMIIIVSLLYFIFNPSRQIIGNISVGLLITAILYVLLSFAKLYPALSYFLINPQPAKQMSMEMIIREPIIDVLALYPHHFVGFRFNSPYYDRTPYTFLLITAFAPIYLISIRRIFHRDQKFYLLSPLILAIFSIMLSSKEFNVDQLILNSNTLARLLRHADRNMSLLSLALSIMVSCSLYSLYYILKTNKNFLKKLLVLLFTFLIVLTSAISSWPFFTGDMNGYWNPAPPPQDYIEANRILKSIEEDYSHVIWIPQIGDARALWSRQGGPFPVSAPTGLFELRSSSLPSYYIWDKYFFLYYNIINGTFGPVSPYPIYSGPLAKIYSLLNIKYLAIVYDRSWPPIYVKGGITNKMLLKTVQKLRDHPYTKLIWKGHYLAVFKLNNNSSEIFVGVKPLLCYCKLNKIASIMELMDSFNINAEPALLFLNKESQKFWVSYLVNVIISDYSLIPIFMIEKGKTIIITPRKYTLTVSAAKSWAKGELDGFNLRCFFKQGLKWNWDTDLGYGFTYTWAPRATLTVPFKLLNGDKYVFLMRYFKNQKGGVIRVYLDGKPITEINTISQLNRFVWKDLGVYKLGPGRHVLTLENVYGFNAVNVFVFVPVEEYGKLVKDFERLLENKTVIYIFEAESDMFRSKARIVRNINASNGEELLLNADGSAWQDFEVVRGGYYMLAVRLKGSARLVIDNNTFSVGSSKLRFVYVGPVYLSKGIHRIVVAPTTKPVDLDVVWIYSVRSPRSRVTVEDLFKVKERPAKVVSYERVNPTLWRAEVEARKPFMLVFAEAYDPLWEARVYRGGSLIEVVRSVPVYGVINGFWINETGNLTISIRYIPQDWFELGLKISVATFILCILYLIYDRGKGKDNNWVKHVLWIVKYLCKQKYHRTHI